MTLHVELDRLAGLGPILQGLASEAAQLGPSAPFCPTQGVEPAVLEAISIAESAVDLALVNTVKERLSETGEIMVNLARQYAAVDDDRALSAKHGAADAPGVPLETVMATYANAVGDWDVPEVAK